jgi:hypothetical protein
VDYRKSLHETHSQAVLMAKISTRPYRLDAYSRNKIMKKEYWLPSVVFLAASIPTVLILQALAWGGDYVLLLSMGVGALATSFILPKLKKPTLGDDTSSMNSAPTQPKKKQ